MYKERGNFKLYFSNDSQLKIFTSISPRKLMLGELLKYHFKPEFDGILQYFSPP